MSKSNITSLDPRLRETKLSYLNKDMLCQIANKLTKPIDIAHFMESFKNAETTAKRCVTAIISPKEAISADFVLFHTGTDKMPKLRFYNLQELKVRLIAELTNEQYLFLRFKMETDNEHWHYVLGADHLLEEGNEDMSVPTELVAYELDTGIDFIIELLKLRSEEDRDLVLDQLIHEIFAHFSESELIKLVKTFDFDYDDIFVHALANNMIKLLEALKRKNYHITARILDYAIDDIFTSRGDPVQLDEIFPALKYLIFNNIINVKDLSFLLQYPIDAHDPEMIVFLVESGVPVTQKTLRKARVAEVPEEIMKYLREHSGYEVNEY